MYGTKTEGYCEREEKQITEFIFSVIPFYLETSSRNIVVRILLIRVVKIRHVLSCDNEWDIADYAYA